MYLHMNMGNSCIVWKAFVKLLLVIYLHILGKAFQIIFWDYNSLTLSHSWRKLALIQLFSMIDVWSTNESYQWISFFSVYQLCYFQQYFHQMASWIHGIFCPSFKPQADSFSIFDPILNSMMYIHQMASFAQDSSILHSKTLKCIQWITWCQGT